MCLLNGDVSGNLPFNVDFANEEYIDSTGKSTFTPIPIKMILQKALIEFGKEMSHNVIINNIDESGLELLEYRGEDPLFLVKSTLSGEYVTFFLKTNSGYQSCYYDLKETISAE
jgi:hypothetical protein